MKTNELNQYEKSLKNLNWLTFHNTFDKEFETESSSHLVVNTIFLWLVFMILSIGLAIA